MNLVIMGNGAMGKIAGELAEEYPDIDTVETLEPRNGESLFDLRMRPDVIIDFSHPDVLSEICDYLKLQGGQTGVVFATTGFSETDLECIQKLSNCVPVIQSYNYSFGVNAMKRLLHMAVSLLQNHAYIEIIEKQKEPCFLNYLIKHICQENNVVSMDLNGQTIYTGHDYAQEF